MTRDSLQCVHRRPGREAGVDPLPCIQDAGHDGAHRDALGNTWAPRTAPEHDPLETTVEVSDDAMAVIVTIDGYQVMLPADPASVEDSVDVLRRVSAACQFAIRLLRNPEVRQAALDGPGDLRWLDESEVEARVWPPTR